MIGSHVSAWRRHRRLTQEELARRSGLSRPYLSRLEREEVDPALSCVRRIAGALQLSVGDLIEKEPAPRILGRNEMDALARGALRPGTSSHENARDVRRVARLVKERRRSLGLYKPRGSTPHKTSAENTGAHSLRWLKAELGEDQWKALLRKIEKHSHPL